MLTINFSKTTLTKLLSFCHGTILMIFVKKLIKMGKKVNHPF